MNKIFAFPFLAAVVSGITMAVQGTLNSVLAQKSSLLSSTLVVHFIGTVFTLVLVLIYHTPLFRHPWLFIPWYYYLGGILSAMIIGLVAFSIPQIGVANATTAIITGQVGMALLIDHFGWFGVEKLPWNFWQLLGFIFFAIGAKLLFIK